MVEGILLGLSEKGYAGTLILIARPDSSHSFKDTAKKIYLTCLCIQINKTVAFSNHTNIKQI